MHVLMCVLMLVVPSSQSRGQDYVGSWVAELNGTPFISLDIQMANGRLAGHISYTDMHVDDKGVVDRTGPMHEPKPVNDAAVVGSGLRFTSPDDDDTNHYEMRLIDATTAELQLVLTDAEKQELAADGVHLPVPFRLKRVSRRPDPSSREVQGATNRANNVCEVRFVGRIDVDPFANVKRRQLSELSETR
jgi:hypothetical protein